MAEINDNLNEGSYLENVTIYPAGNNPFEKSNTWWYIIGICFFGVLGNNAENMIYSLTSNRFKNNDFYLKDNYNLIVFVILPIVYFIFSKVIFFIFIHKKWKFICNTNSEVPYHENVVLKKYIAPVIYFIIGSIILTLLTATANSYSTIYLTLIFRGLILIGFSIYLIVWNYRLSVYFPKYFNQISNTISNNFYLPKNIGVLIWLIPILTSLFLYINLFLNPSNSYNKDENNLTYYIGRTFQLFHFYSNTIFYIIFAIYIYIIIKTAKQFYKTKVDIL